MIRFNRLFFCLLFVATMHAKPRILFRPIRDGNIIYMITELVINNMESNRERQAAHSQHMRNSSEVSVNSVLLHNTSQRYFQAGVNEMVRVGFYNARSLQFIVIAAEHEVRAEEERSHEFDVSQLD